MAASSDRFAPEEAKRVFPGAEATGVPATLPDTLDPVERRLTALT
jgi:hypothetical protein